MTTAAPIPFHRPTLGEAERNAVMEVLESGWLTTGPRVAEFERAFAAATGSRHAIAVNSATAALHLALEGIGVTDGDEVIVPTYTFAASAEVVLYLRGRPVLADVDPSTANLTADAVRSATTARTRAVEVVHIAGAPADLPALLEACGGTPLVEDAAHAFPSAVAALDGRFAGTVGRAGAFSFYATKTITTGEGGMLATDDEALADRARSMRLHGIGRDAWRRYAAAGSWYYEIEAAGFKDNLTDLAAAIGLVQLQRASALREARAHIARRYLEALEDAEREGLLVLPAGRADPGHAWHLFMVRLGPLARASEGADAALPGVAALPGPLRAVASRRARTIAELGASGIGTSVHFIPLHLHPLYRQMGYRAGDFPNAETIYASEISLPIWPGMSDEQVARVADALVAALRP